MPVRMTWENKTKTVVRFDLIELWTSEELRSMVLSAVYDIAIDQRPYTVILRFTDGALIPGNLLSIMRQVYELTPDNLKQLVVVSKYHPLLSAVCEVFYRMTNVKVRLVYTMEEAKQLSMCRH